MNKIYKTIWSKTRKTFAAVSEAHSSHSSGKSKAVSVLAPAATVIALGIPSFAVAADVDVDAAANLPSGATYAEDTLVNTSTSLPDASCLVIGINERAQQIVPTSGTPNVLNVNIGFKNVTGVRDGLFINNGRQFLLVGDSSSIDLADGTVWVGSIHNEDGETTQSTLTLGSFGSVTATKGHLVELNVGIRPLDTAKGMAGGAVVLKNGEFSVDTLRNGAEGNDSDGVKIEQGASLSVKNYTSVDAGQLKNSGTFHAENITSTNRYNGLVNLGKLTAETVDFTGIVKNEGAAEITELTLRETGSENAENSSLTVTNLTLAGDVKSPDGSTDATHEGLIRGELTNNGTLKVNGTANVAGALVNNNELSAGEMTVQAKAAAAEKAARDGSFINNGQATLSSLISDAGIQMTNSGTLTVNDRLVLTGNLANENEAVLSAAGELNIAYGGTLVNAGTMSVDFLKTDAAGQEAKITNSGKFIVLSQKGSSGLGINITNTETGEFTIKSGNSTTFTGGKFTNDGTFNTESDLLFLGSNAVFENNGTANLNGITINGKGKLVNSNSGVFTDTGTVQLNIDAQDDVGLSNSGTMELNQLTITKGLLSGSGSLKVTNAVVQADGRLQGGSVAFGSLDNQGSVSGNAVKIKNGSNTNIVNADDSLLIEQGGTFTNEKAGTIFAGTGISVQGVLVNKGGALADTVVKNGGTLTAQADTKLDMLTLNQGASLNAAAGKTFIKNLTAEGATYTQTEGTFKAENGWFANSTLNIEGGILNVAEANKDGILGNNTVNISGKNAFPSFDNSKDPAEKKAYRDNLTQVVVSNLTSESVVNIGSGGLLDVENISLTENKKTLTLAGGAIQTSADQIFNQTKKEAIRLDATEPGQSVELPGNLMTSSEGAVKDSVKAGLALNSGNLVFDDETFSATLVAAVAESLNNAFGSLSNLTVNFLGSSAGIFTVKDAEKLASKLQSNGRPDVVLNGVTLYNGTSENDAPDWLNIGNTGLAANMGFKDIALATGVTINDGKELALVGNVAGTLSDADFTSDLNKLLTSAADGGSISVENGTLTLGTNGAAESSVGWIYASKVTEEGNINVKNGQFAIWDLANDGSVNIAANAALRVNNLEGVGTIDNQGQFLVKDYKGKEAAFELNGAFANTGASSLLDASAAENSFVNNYLQNEGKTLFKNLTVSETGTLVNAGTEKGEVLKLKGSYEGSGKSVWNSVSVDDTGTLEIGGTFTVAEGLVVKGDLDNAGTLSYRYANVTEDATMTNSGTETGESLSLALGAERTNKGSTSLLIFNVGEGASSTTEAGASDTVTGNFKVEGAHINKGTLNASGSEVKGHLTNLANATFNSLSLIENGLYENKGSESGGDMTLNEGSVYKSSGKSQWKYVTVRDADLYSSGAFAAENFALTGGAVSLTGGEFKTANAVLDGGAIAVGDAAASVKAELATSVPVKSAIAVHNGSELGFGVGALAYAEMLNAPKGSARLCMTQKAVFAEGSSLTVGENSKPAALDATGAISLVFGEGTTTLVDSSLLKDDTGVFSTTAKGATLTVAPTAALILGSIDEAGDYTVVSGFDTGDNVSDSGWTGGWTGDKLYALAQDGTGINWELELHNDASKVWVTAVLNDVRSMYPDIAVPNIANDELRHAQKDAFTYGVLKSKDLSVAQKTAILNSAANIGFAGGALSVGFNDLTTALDSVESRVSMKGESFTEEGLMRDWTLGNNLWIDLTGGTQKYKSFSATGIDKAGYKSDAFGFTLGFDRKVTPTSILGAAFSYSHGSLDSTGEVTKTKNKYNSYGVHAYGAYSPNARFNVVGTLTYLRSSSDITQHVNAAGFGKADADVKTNLFAAGIRAESTWKAGSASIIPHAGIRYVHAKSDKYDAKVDGKKIWSNKAKANNAVQFPIGFALRGDIPTVNGWNIRPQADVTIIPQAGSVKQKTTLTNVNGILDRVNGEFAGHFGTNVNLGVQADKGNATLGLRYGFTGGSKGKADHAVRLEARWRF